MSHYTPPEFVTGTVFDPEDATFGPIMAAIQAGDFEVARDKLDMLASESIFKPAIERIQKIRDEAAHAQLEWYVSRLMGEDTEGLTTEQLQELFEADDYFAWEGTDSEDIEAWENWEVEISAFNRVLDILQILAHGGTPEQGS